MRILGGRLRGRKVPLTVGAGIRPTPARVRGAFFDVLGHDLGNCSFLDATGGSGVMAVEAASRGADPVWVVERVARNCHRIRRRILSLGLEGQIQVRCADALDTHWRGRDFHLVFADPPYAVALEPWVRSLHPLAREWLVVEHHRRTVPPPVPGTDAPPKRRRYGDTVLSFYPGSGSLSTEGRAGEGSEPVSR